MNDRQDPYDPYAAQEQQLIGYDPYGRPVYGPAPAQAPAPAYEQPYGYDHQGYAPQQPYPQQQQPAQDHGTQGGAYGQEQYAPGPGYGYDTQQAQQWIPQQHAPQEQAPGQQAPRQQPAPDPRPAPQVPQPRRAAPGPGTEPEAGRDYRTEMFAFIDQPDEESEDVIDWLAFTESRTERREEARRRGRNRTVALIVVLALIVVGGAGYLWYAGKLPFLDGPGGQKKPAAATGAQKRDMIVVHVLNTKKGGSSTLLLVDNVTTKQGATVLLPNTLNVPKEDGTGQPLSKSVEDGGIGTRESLDSVLGTRIGGTWRLDTPFLERLVELVGGIEVDTDTAVPADDQAKTPAVSQGAKQSLTGAMAVAYATHRAQGEPETKQLERLGKVLYAVLRKIPADPKAAAVTVESMGQILDPALNAQNLGALLSRIGEHAKVGAYRTEVLPVKPDGGLGDDAGKKAVDEILGGSAAAVPGAAPRIGLKDATGDEKAQLAAKAALLNGGYTLVEGGKADKSAALSQITYRDEAQRAKAVEVAKTLGLPETAVKKAESAVNADVVVVLGKDYKAS
ncbi:MULTISPECIES: LCP family protein [unclassified Streptomyces]|uniref:LCP family protein n=1 Tax=unclassified Streptomyces TaxID=2593676 RepID=UPI002E37FF36|nr:MULTISPECIES: LytR C-terminal domain-containing protein [unclassified Streptomyces]WUC66489.1 LytR C-terminal domain-containing protein [Streptomyces sp. NBC_00539]